MRWRRDKLKYGWEVTVGWELLSPWIRGVFDSFGEAVDGARTIEWGFEVEDAREPELYWRVALDPKTERELDEWLDRLTALDESALREEVDQFGGSFTFRLGAGGSTKPTGKVDALPYGLRIRALTRQDRRGG